MEVGSAVKRGNRRGWQHCPCGYSEKIHLNVGTTLAAGRTTNPLASPYLLLPHQPENMAQHKLAYHEVYAVYPDLVEMSMFSNK